MVPIRQVLGGQGRKSFGLDVSGFETPQPGLVQIGSSPFYMTPNEPVDPFDCERWPDSIYCGGNPFGGTLAGLNIGLVANECDFGVQAQGSLGFIKLPQFQFIYRSPGCVPSSNVPPGPPPPLASPGKWEKVGASPGANCTIFYACTEYFGPRNYTEVFGGTISNFDSSRIPGFQGWVECGYIEPAYDRDAGSYSIPRSFHVPNDREDPCTEPGHQFITYYTSVSYKGDDALRNGGYVWVKLPTIDVFFPEYAESWQFAPPWTVVDNSCDRPITPPSPPILPPPPPKYPCCMACCPPPNDDLLKRILKKLEALEEFLGTKELEKPAKYPKRLVTTDKNGEVEVKNIAQLLDFQVRQLDRVIGYFPQRIKVTDTNPGQAGNQSIELEVHSVGDFLREILQYVIDIEGDGDTTNNMLVRCLYELGFVHQGGVQTQFLVDAIVEHLDFKHKYKTVKVPFAFDPYAEDSWIDKTKRGVGFDKNSPNNKADENTEYDTEKLLPALLRNKEIKIKVIENIEKQSLNDHVQQILRQVAVAANALGDNASAERLEALVNAAQAVIQLQSTIDRKNVRQALAGGDLRTRKKNE